MLLWDLFAVFFRIGLLSFGGGYASLSLIETHIVHNKMWVSPKQFVDLLTLSEMTPGPISISAATFVGKHVAGVPGSIVASLGVVAPSVFIVLTLSILYFKFKNFKMVQGTIQGIRPAVVALIASAGLSILLTVLFGGQAFLIQNLQWLSLFLMIGSFLLLRKTRLSPIAIMLLSGTIGMLLYSF